MKFSDTEIVDISKIAHETMREYKESLGEPLPTWDNAEPWTCQQFMNIHTIPIRWHKKLTIFFMNFSLAYSPEQCYKRIVDNNL